MKRKILSLALVIAMLASMLVVVPTTGAAELATVEVTNAVGVAGDTVSVNVVVTTATMSGYQFVFEYDRTRLELVKSGSANGSMPAGNGFNGAVDSADESYSLMNWCGTVKNAQGEAVLDAEGNPIPAAFSSIFWIDTEAVQHDCTAGVAAATLTFKIKEDATPGDAYVSIGYLCGDSLDSKGENVVKNYLPNKIETANGTVNAEGDIAFNPGKITVLPDGYADTTVTDLSDFTVVLWDEDYGEKAWYADEADYAIITGYTGSDATVVIPEAFVGEYLNGDTEIEQVTTPIPVTVIQSTAFKNKAIDSVVIPATVTEVQEAAFVGCSTLTDVYVLGEDTVFATKAIGYSGDARRATTGVVDWRSEATLLTDENGDALTTIYGAAGSTAEAFAASETLGWENLRKVTFGGCTAYTGANTVAPGQMLNDGEVIAAWKNGDTVLAPGAEMTLTADTTLTPIAITAPTLVNGVSLKITEAYEDFAMRFTSTLSVADYNALRALGKVTMGTIITPAAYVERAGALTKEALGTLNTENKYIDVATTGSLKEADGVYTFAGSVRNFKKANRDVDYAAAFYLTVELADGSTFTVYSAYNHNANRNLGDTMTKLADSGTLNGDPRLTWLENHIASFSN